MSGPAAILLETWHEMLLTAIGVRHRILVLAAMAFLATGCGGSGGSDFGAGESSGGIVRALKAHGLPIGAITVFDASTDPAHLLSRPGFYTGKAAFRDTRVTKSHDPTDFAAGGGVELFASDGDAKRRVDFERSLATSSAVFDDYNYRRGRVFLRISNELTPAQAQQYEIALNELK
jgi:hypothetical protein